MEIHNQLFLPKDLRPGEKRPAIVFVHGGPVRQMLLGVSLHGGLSPLLRRQPVAREPGLRRDVGELSRRHRLRQVVPHGAEHEPRGNSEYQDVLAGGKYLQTRADVDPKRRRASGGCRTAACSRRRRWRATPTSSSPASISPASISTATASIPRTLAYKSSAISEIDNWKSPVSPDPGRRRSQRQLRADGRPRAAAARAQRALRAVRDARRHARDAAPQALAADLGAHGSLPEQVPEEGRRRPPRSRRKSDRQEIRRPIATSCW